MFLLYLIIAVGLIAGTIYMVRLATESEETTSMTDETEDLASEVEMGDEIPLSDLELMNYFSNMANDKIPVTYFMESPY